MTKPKIVDIPIKMEKFYGKGKMLHPSRKVVEELIKTVPKGRIATIDTVAKRLAKDFNTDVTCPMRTGNAIKKLAEEHLNVEMETPVPFWRIIRSDKLIIKSKGMEYAASMIEAEGFDLEYTKSGSIKVKLTANDLFGF